MAAHKFVDTYSML